MRFFQQPVRHTDVGTALTTKFGTKDIAATAVASPIVARAATHIRVTLDFDMGNPPAPFPAIADANEMPVTILAHPSDFIEASFENTEGLVEGVSEAYYTNKISVKEIGASAKRIHTHATTSNAVGHQALAFSTVTQNKLVGAAVVNTANSAFGVNTGLLETMWVDDKNPTIKVGYDETEQRLTFDGDNGKLGLGTGIGMNSFTVYSKKLDAGTNGMGIPAFGNNKDVSLATDDKVIGNSFLNTGADLQAQNKRYGMSVYFDTVNNLFEVKSGTTGEALVANTVQSVVANQSKSDVSIGRYKLTNVGERDATDDAEYAFHKIGKGTNQILGFPREGAIGYTAGIAGSKPAVVTGREALVDMQNAFTLTDAGSENRFNIVVNGVSAFIELPQMNYTGITMATALEARINQMQHPTTGKPVGGVDVTYNGATNNLVFTTGTSGNSSTFKIEGALRFGLKDIPLGIGSTTQIKTPVQATDDLGRPLFISPSGEITSRTDEFADNIVEDFYPLLPR